MWGGMGGGGWLGMILFWGLIILLIAALVKWLSDKNTGAAGEETPLQVLKKRYARGEIGDKEFEQKRHDLEK